MFGGCLWLPWGSVEIPTQVPTRIPIKIPMHNSIYRVLYIKWLPVLAYGCLWLLGLSDCLGLPVAAWVG